ncbi:hypothetical protein [Sphingomonas paucimobilis]|uniref:hypothetical protein n=1 Tax=Sphingomonas paucimobilis TaxID=13689 RepID=UPI0030FBAA44
MDIPTNAELISSIEAFLKRTEMRPTRFGRLATGEPQLIASLKLGRSPSLDTASRIVRFMSEYQPSQVAA